MAGKCAGDEIINSFSPDHRYRLEWNRRLIDNEELNDKAKHLFQPNSLVFAKAPMK